MQEEGGEEHGRRHFFFLASFIMSDIDRFASAIMTSWTQFIYFFQDRKKEKAQQS